MTGRDFVAVRGTVTVYCKECGAGFPHPGNARQYCSTACRNSNRYRRRYTPGPGRAECGVEGCTTPIDSHGYCAMHAARWMRNGTMEVKTRPTPWNRTLEERFWTFVDKNPDTECWVWNGGTSSGYGVIGVGSGLRLAHRVSWEMFVGPIPDGLHIDHLCRNRPCCNPAHLEPVTQAENNRRAADAKRAMARR